MTLCRYISIHGSLKMSLPYLVTARCEIESITRKPGAETAALTASR